MATTKTNNWLQIFEEANRGEPLSDSEWALLSPEERELLQDLIQQGSLNQSLQFLNNIQEDVAWNKVKTFAELSPSAPSSKAMYIQLVRYAAIFAGVLVLSATIYFLNKKEHLTSALAQLVVPNKYITEPISPNKAMLILENGQRVNLENLSDSNLTQDGAMLNITDSSLLSYEHLNSDKQVAGFNTLVIPRGGAYKLKLADGSIIWLNAASKLRYPTHFNGVAKRTIYLDEGEAFFEISKNNVQPFVVIANDAEIAVLGTSFNLNLYSGSMISTLATGSVKISKDQKSTVLVPGQQAKWQEDDWTKATVDVASYIDWKDGKIIYEAATLEEVLTNIGRLYDYTVQFDSETLKQSKFGGMLRKSKQVEDMLQIIAKTGNVSFRIKDKTIYVSMEEIAR